MKHQASPGRRRIKLLGQRAQANLASFQFFHGFDELPHRARQSIKLPDDQGVPLAQVVQGGGQLRAVPLRTAGLLRENPFTASLVQGIDLKLRRLIHGGHTGIANQHKILLLRTQKQRVVMRRRLQEIVLRS
jgi:hypothetical protein